MSNAWCPPTRQPKVPAPPQFYVSSAAWKYAQRQKRKVREMFAHNGLNEIPPCGCKTPYVCDTSGPRNGLNEPNPCCCCPKPVCKIAPVEIPVCHNNDEAVPKSYQCL